MPNMTSYEFGDVVLVPFPFTDQRSTKKRPAVVVSSAAYHRDRVDLIVMAVTSHLRAMTAMGETIVNQWKEAGLLKPSVIKPVVATLERRLVLKKLGHLGEQDREALRRTLRIIVG